MEINTRQPCSAARENSSAYKPLNWKITKCHSTEKNVHYSGVLLKRITNYLVNNKNICYSRVTKLNQAEQWDIDTMQDCLQICV